MSCRAVAMMAAGGVVSVKSALVRNTTSLYQGEVGAAGVLRVEGRNRDAAGVRDRVLRQLQVMRESRARRENIIRKRHAAATAVTAPRLADDAPLDSRPSNTFNRKTHDEKVAEIRQKLGDTSITKVHTRARSAS